MEGDWALRAEDGLGVISLLLLYLLGCFSTDIKPKAIPRPPNHAVLQCWLCSLPVPSPQSPETWMLSECNQAVILHMRKPRCREGKSLPGVSPPAVGEGSGPAAWAGAANACPLQGKQVYHLLQPPASLFLTFTLPSPCPCGPAELRCTFSG